MGFELIKHKLINVHKKLGPHVRAKHLVIFIFYVNFIRVTSVELVRHKICFADFGLI